MSIRCIQTLQLNPFWVTFAQIFKVRNRFIGFHSLCALKVVGLCSNVQKIIFELQLLTEDLIPQGNCSGKVINRRGIYNRSWLATLGSHLQNVYIREYLIKDTYKALVLHQDVDRLWAPLWSFLKSVRVTQRLLPAGSSRVGSMVSKLFHQIISFKK